MSDNPAEKRGGFERWVASLKLGAQSPPSTPPAEGEPEAPTLTLDEQATLINRIPKEVIYKLRERDSQRSTPDSRGMPKSDDSTAVFTPPPELLARARRFQAPPKPERSSPTASAPPAPPAAPNLAAAEDAAFSSLSDEEPTQYFKPDISDLPSTVPPAALAGDISRPGDIHWIDGLPSSRPGELAPSSGSVAPTGGSIAPAERRVRWVALIVAIVLIGSIILLSRMQ